ncbi:MAG: PaaI family thioesterase [Gordonia sp. (in: high G+C Gram-positive bacteria)]|uniref:PaaI family thioesterase n=1 Tax=Gordonia sp. (in: high G+C Gram-positive bacteria) TaxID=84139 RepID=UPI003C74D2A8
MTNHDRSAPAAGRQTTQATLELGNSVLRAQPFSNLVGATISRFDAGGAVLEIEITDHHRQQHGLVHGGVLSYLVDNALTFACGSILGPDIVTRSLSVTYLEGARDGQLRATATVTAHTDRHAVATVTVDEVRRDGSTRTCAVGQGAASTVGRQTAPI